MINGRILVTPDTVARWLREALAIDQEQRHVGRKWFPDGGTIIYENISQHCRTWHFGPADQKLLEEHVIPLYLESKAFLEI